MKPGAALEEQPLCEETVYRHEKRHEPTSAAKAIHPPEPIHWRGQELLGFQLSVAFLVAKPPGKRFLVVVIEGPVEPPNLPVHPDTLGMSILLVTPAVWSKKHHSIRIQSPAKRSAEDAVADPYRVPLTGWILGESMHRFDQLGGHEVVRIQREDPLRVYEGEPVIPLIGMPIEGTLGEFHPGVRLRNLLRAIRTEAIQYNNSLRPGEPCEGTRQVGLLVEREDQRRYAIKHESCPWEMGLPCRSMIIEDPREALAEGRPAEALGSQAAQLLGPIEQRVGMGPLENCGQRAREFGRVVGIHQYA